MSRHSNRAFGNKYKDAPLSKVSKRTDGRMMRMLKRSETNEWFEWLNQSWEEKPKRVSKLVW